MRSAQQAVNGVLVFIARDDRSDIIVPDRAGVAAGWFTPDVCDRFARRWSRSFAAKTYDAGITAAVDGILNVYRAHAGSLRQTSSSTGAVRTRSELARNRRVSYLHVLVDHHHRRRLSDFALGDALDVDAALRTARRAAGRRTWRMPNAGYGAGYGGYGGGGGGSFWSGLLGGFGGAWLGNEMFGNRGGGRSVRRMQVRSATARRRRRLGRRRRGGGWQSDAGQADVGGASGGDWSGGGFGGDGGGGGDFGGGGGGDSGGGW